MTVQALAEMLSAKIINNADFTRQIATGYAGELLSFVMGKAPADSAWFTVMTNINICAVAHLADVAVIVLCEDSEPMPGVTDRAKEQGINIISTSLDIFSAIKKVLNEGQI